MKKTMITLVFLCGALLMSRAQGITPPADGKAVVYFVRVALAGALINFSYFDNDKYLGKANGDNYLRYECEPGEHLFWATSENRDFVTAELEAGKIYFLEGVPRMGAIKAAVQLVPVDPKNVKKMTKIQKLVKKRAPKSLTEAELQAANNEQKEKIANGLEKYKEEVAQGRQVDRLEKTMYYEISPGS